MKALVLSLILLTGSLAAAAQPQAEAALILDENFFDALIDGIYAAADPPSIKLAGETRSKTRTTGNAFAGSECGSVKLVRENNGVRTAVRIRDGKIATPLAFTGSYEPPLIGCVGFSGYAESVIDLEFDPSAQRLTARLRVQNVVLSGTGGVGSSLVAKMVQSSIDKRINPIEIVRLDQLSFAVPIQNTAGMRMRAKGMRTELHNRAIIIYINYEFLKN